MVLRCVASTATAEEDEAAAVPVVWQVAAAMAKRAVIKLMGAFSVLRGEGWVPEGQLQPVWQFGWVIC